MSKLPQDYTAEEIYERNRGLCEAGLLPSECKGFITKPKTEITQLNHLIIPRGREGRTLRKWMKQFLDQWHYLDANDVYGRRIFFWWYDTCVWDVVAIVMFSSPRTLNLKDRDNWIGWTTEQRLEKLNKHVCDETRFLVVPHVRVKNLQSQILAKSCKLVKAEWEKRYGNKLALITCFTNPELYGAHSYKAAAFETIGKTKTGLNIMVRPISKHWKNILMPKNQSLATTARDEK